MSLLGFLAKNINQPIKVQLTKVSDSEAKFPITFDATPRLVHSREVSITKNPVESGANISDHARLGNVMFELESIISEAPLSIVNALIGGIAAGAIGTQVGGLAASLVTAGVAAGANAATNFALSPTIPKSSDLETQVANRQLGDITYPELCYRYLQALQQDRELLKINSRFFQTTNLLISRLSLPQTAEIGRSIRCTIGLEEVQITESRISLLTENKIDQNAAPGAATKTSLGKQATSTATDAQSSQPSILKQIFSSFGG